MGENISGINYLNNIELMPVSTGLSLRSKKEILDKLLIDYTIASIATYAFCSSYDLIITFLTALDDKFYISNIINGKDKELIINIYNKKISKKNLQEITYRFESAYTCMWALGLTNNITYKNKCSVKAINELLLGSNKYDELFNKCDLRSTSEILSYYSDIAKLLYSNNSVDEVIKNIANNQDSAVRYIVLYNFNKNGLKVRYQKEELKFEFELPEELKFENISSEVLFALKGSDGLRILGQVIEDDKIQNNIKKLTNSGFEVLDVNYVTSLYLESRILKVNLKKKEMLVNAFYLYLGNHLIRIDFSVTKRNVESNIIYSIKIFE